MLKKTITYTDFNGNSQTDVCYFNMNKAELGRMQVKMDGKYLDYLKGLIEKKRIEALYDFIYNLVLDSYGEKSDDGLRFMKDPEMRWKFECSVAFSEILIDLIGDKDKLSEFVKRILPPDMLTSTGEIDAAAIPANV